MAVQLRYEGSSYIVITDTAGAKTYIRWAPINAVRAASATTATIATGSFTVTVPATADEIINVIDGVMPTPPA